MSVAVRWAKITSVVTLCMCIGVGLGCGHRPAKTPESAARKSTMVVSFDPPPDLPPLVAYTPCEAGTLTFNKDIAPIVFEKCATCHHPGEVGPFSLLSYEDVTKRASQIVEVIEKRTMPPWSPLPGYCDFERDRGLSANEIGKIAQWVNEGAALGDPSDFPPVPKFKHGWKYGDPNMIVTMPEPFLVPADSATDVYRKFVIRVPIEETKYVRAFDFQPGNPAVVHHMRLRVDRSSLSRTQDSQDPLPGFDGTMFSGDTEPDGFFLVWTPGYEAVPKRIDAAWTLQKGTDLVLELHLHPTGKEEAVQSSIALYFQPEKPRSHVYAADVQRNDRHPCGNEGADLRRAVYSTRRCDNSCRHAACSFPGKELSILGSSSRWQTYLADAHRRLELQLATRIHVC